MKAYCWVDQMAYEMAVSRAANWVLLMVELTGAEQAVDLAEKKVAGSVVWSVETKAAYLAGKKDVKSVAYSAVESVA